MGGAMPTMVEHTQECRALALALGVKSPPPIFIKKNKESVVEEPDKKYQVQPSTGASLI